MQVYAFAYLFGTFIVHIYRKEDYHFKCGIDEFGQYFVETKKF